MAKVVHFEIPVDDAARARAFYEQALGWQISGWGDEPYWMVRAGADDEVGANGALIGRHEVHQSPVLVVGVANIDDALGKVTGAGGQVLRSKEAVPGIGWAAYVRDTEQNVIGLFQPDDSAR